MLKELLRTAPSLLGELARYIDSRLESSQPGISLSVTLSFLGALKSGRIKNDFGIAPNIYTCTIAPSGIGKSMAQGIISDLCHECGLFEMLMGRPASDGGILSRLSKTQRMFLQWDEFGLALSELTKPGAPSYRVNILSTLMDLFSMAGRHYIGKEYADEKKTRADIDKPYLSFSGASTPKRFFDALNEDFILDGFLSRILTFDCGSEIVFQEPSKDPIPELIVNWVKEINTGERRAFGGNLEVILCQQEHWLKVPDEIVSIIRDKIRYKITAAKSEVSRIFWSRGFEYFIKICMALADSKGHCGENETLYAFKLLEFLLTSIINRCQIDVLSFQADKVQNHKLNKVLELLDIGEEVTATVLSKRAYDKKISKKERDTKIEELLELEFFFKRCVASTNHKEVTYFKRIL